MNQKLNYLAIQFQLTLQIITKKLQISKNKQIIIKKSLFKKIFKVRRKYEIKFRLFFRNECIVDKNSFNEKTILIKARSIEIAKIKLKKRLMP